MTNTVTVRVAKEADVTTVDALLARSYPVLLRPHYPAALLDRAMPYLARAKPALVTCGTYYVALLDGMVVGAGGWTIADSDRASANVRHVVTDHKHVRKGVGRALMTRVLVDAANSGATRMHCLSTLNARPFYAALGFKTVGSLDFPIADDVEFPAIEMEIDLQKFVR